MEYFTEQALTKKVLERVRAKYGENARDHVTEECPSWRVLEPF